MNVKTFGVYYKKYFEEDKTIQKIARKLARNNVALYQELVQVGLITLWQLDPKKAKTNQDSWIRQAIKYKMVDFLRAEFGQRPNDVSLDVLLAQGAQVEKDADTGHFLLTNRVVPPDTFDSRQTVDTSEDEILFEYLQRVVEEDTE